MAPIDALDGNFAGAPLAVLVVNATWGQRDDDRLCIPAQIAWEPSPKLELGSPSCAVDPPGRHLGDAPTCAPGFNHDFKIDFKSISAFQRELA